MKAVQRRTFIKNSAITAGAFAAAPAYIPAMISNSPNSRINVAVVGIAGERKRTRGIIRGRGMVHIRNFSEIPNVSVGTLCDIDERLFPQNEAMVEILFGSKPKTEVDFRNVLEDPGIDVVSLASPDHWHALQTVWACQAGKDVYVEKPVSHNLAEGRKMVEAAAKYDRIVQAGICYRSSSAVKEGIGLIREGILGKPYMARGITYRYRVPIGVFPDGPVPDGVNWDMFLGPAPYRPFNINRFLYHWHWFWDTGTAEIGNNGIYRMDTARWALGKDTHPVKVQSTGGLFGRDPREQEVPNIMNVTYEYEDGTIIQNEMRGLPSNSEGSPEDSGVRSFIYGDEGYMAISSNGYRTYLGRRGKPGPAKTDDDFPQSERSNGWKNLIECVKNGRKQDLDNPIIEGHLSASLCHLGIASYRAGQQQSAFNPKTERFINNAEADRFLHRENRHPYIMPETV